jgi:NAD(P)-dependent dehydrogenase (short-subunit alcohol dehydrogenase family)
VSAPLRGTTAVVTGAASGIGAACAALLADRGADVALLDRDAAALAAHDGATRAGRLLALPVDVTDDAALAAAVGRAEAELGPVRVGVLSAGVQLFGQDARLGDVDPQVWERTVRVNLTGAFLSARHCLRAMERAGGGSLVFIGSPTGLLGVAPGFTAYSASKAGVHGLVRVAAADYAAAGIRVNAVIPGYTATPLVRTISDDPTAEGDLLAGVPLRRPGTPQDVAAMVGFLASPESTFCTGGFYPVDGGMTAV